MTTMFASLKTEKLNLSLVDIVGRQIMVQAFNGKSNTIQVDMSRLQSGTYLLELRNVGGQLIKSFEIIKAQ